MFPSQCVALIEAKPAAQETEGGQFFSQQKLKDLTHVRIKKQN
jgi:hypothetical protein